MQQPQVIFRTSGTGFWSGDIKPVVITDMQVAYINDRQDFGELRVFFDTQSWNTGDSGLIYTDSQWIQDLRRFLNSHGLPGDDVDYSEQGMQGDNYVSLDVGKDFLDAWRAKFSQAALV
jgi:hypothetical protein